MFNIKDRLYIATFQNKAVETAARYGVGLEYNHTCISDVYKRQIYRPLIVHQRIIFRIRDMGFSEFLRTGVEKLHEILMKILWVRKTAVISYSGNILIRFQQKS